MVDSVLVSCNFSLSGWSHVAHRSVLVARISRSDGRHVTLSCVGVRRVCLVVAVVHLTRLRVMVLSMTVLFLA